METDVTKRTMATDTTDIDWNRELVELLDWHWNGHLRPRLEGLDHHYAAWTRGVRSLGAEGLGRRCGPSEGPYADSSMAALVLHISREAIHHGSELCLLRDLIRAMQGGRRDVNS